jgi:hypothetical protein
MNVFLGGSLTMVRIARIEGNTNYVQGGQVVVTFEKVNSSSTLLQATGHHVLGQQTV